MWLYTCHHLQDTCHRCQCLMGCALKRPHRIHHPLANWWLIIRSRPKLESCSWHGLGPILCSLKRSHRKHLWMYMLLSYSSSAKAIFRSVAKLLREWSLEGEGFQELNWPGCRKTTHLTVFGTPEDQGAQVPQKKPPSSLQKKRL